MSRLIIEDRSIDSSQHLAVIMRMLDTCNGTVRIASPYVTGTGLEKYLANREARLLTAVNARDIASGATSLDSLLFLESLGVELRALPPPQFLHGKVYLFGESLGIVTSANFTHSAMNSNIEVGVEVSPVEATELVNWFDRLFDDSRELDVEQLESLKHYLEGLKLSASFDSAVNKIEEVVDTLHRASVQRHLRNDAIENAVRFFVCNTDLPPRMKPVFKL